VLEVGIVLQVPTPSALPQTWTLKWVYKGLGSATPSLAKVKEVMETRKKERAEGCTTNNNKMQQ
jgi:hypothetical protein